MTERRAAHPAIKQSRSGILYGSPEVSESLFAKPSSLDCIELAIARTGNTRLSTNLREWNSLVDEIKESLSQTAPELFADLNLTGVTLNIREVKCLRSG